MRILMATDAFPPKCGGSGWSTFYLARALLARGHQVELVQPKPGVGGVQTRVYENVSVTEWGYTATRIPGLRAWQRSARLVPFAEFLAERARSADLIHAQHLLTIPPAVMAGRATGIPVISTVRDYWPVCLYGTLWRENDTCPGCQGVERLRCLRQRYGPAALLAYPALPFMARELARRQRALQQSSIVIAVSRFVADKLAGIVQPARLEVVPNLVDIAELERHTVAEREPFLVFIGKLNREKGADWLPEIMARTNAPRVRVVGEGELASRLVQVPNVELCGWLPNARALDLLARARALLFPSRWPEPLSRVLLEAQALGTPTVALDTGGTHDIIQHEVNGLLANDLGGFCAGVTRMLQDDQLWAQLSAGARQIARERFSAPVVVEQMETIYRAAN